MWWDRKVAFVRKALGLSSKLPQSEGGLRGPHFVEKPLRRGRNELDQGPQSRHRISMENRCQIIEMSRIVVMMVLLEADFVENTEDYQRIYKKLERGRRNCISLKTNGNSTK